MKRLLSALCLLAALALGTPAPAALAIVQSASGSQLAGTGVPSNVVLGSLPTVGNMVVVFLHTDTGVTGVTYNSSAYSQLALSITTRSTNTNTYALVRYVQNGDTVTLPAMATAGACHWAYVAYEVSGVAGSIAADVQTIGSGVTIAGGFATVYPVFVQQVAQTTGSLALMGGGNFGDAGVPTLPTGWTSDVAVHNQTNWGSLAGFHYTNPAVGTVISGVNLGLGSAAQVILHTTAPAYPYVRQQYANVLLATALTATGVLHTAPIAGNLEIAFVHPHAAVAAYVTGGSWTEFCRATSGGNVYSVGMERYVQGGDTISLPAFSTTATAVDWGYQSYEVAGTLGVWSTDFQSCQAGTGTQSTTTSSGTTTQANTLALIGMGQNVSGSNSTAPTTSAAWAVDGMFSAGSTFGLSETFASKNASVSASATFPNVGNVGYIQVLLGGTATGHNRPLLGVGN